MKITLFSDTHANLFEHDVEKMPKTVEKFALPNSFEETLRIAKQVNSLGNYNFL